MIEKDDKKNPIPALSYSSNIKLDPTQFGFNHVYKGQECGKQFDFSDKLTNNASKRIVGGEICSVCRWPWQVALISNGKQVCGGSIATADWIVTAAHCFDSGTTCLINLVHTFQY